MQPIVSQVPHIENLNQQHTNPVEATAPSSSPWGTKPEATPDLSTRSSPYLDVREAARFCRCGQKQVYTAARRRAVRHLRTSGRGRLLFRLEWLTAWLERAVVEVGQVGR